ncbi:MAG: TonB-dependent receptor, partial [Pseudomonadota bacterium]|nr:TonB-dependent receptor [Pseudomonadota bacterium]
PASTSGPTALPEGLAPPSIDRPPPGAPGVDPAASTPPPAGTAGPKLLASATPAYPATALAERVSGTVVVRIGLDAAGAVAATEVVQSVRPDLDAAAVEAAWRLRFSPARKDGVPAPSTLDYAFNFTLAVGDEQGNPVPATVHLHVVDGDGLDVPGVKVILTPSAGGEPRVYETGEGGRVHAAFLPPGKWLLRMEKAGFTPSGAEFEVGSGETRAADLTLTPAGPAEEIVVWGMGQRWRDVARAPREPVLEPVTSSYVLTRRDVESTPGALEDVTRAVHKLPGVASDGDMLGTFSVRGATAGEVVFLLDRVPLDNPFHLAGFNSIFNPDMLKEVRFFAGAAPATYPTSTSAVMDVHSWDGAPRDDRSHDLDGAIDISMSTARLLLMGPIGKGDDLTFAIAARRSYLEAYFWAMGQLDLFDTAIAAPEYDELSARVAWRPGKQRFLLTLMRTSDHLALVDSADESIVTIDGTFKLDDVVYLASLDHTVELGAATLQSTAAFTYDESHLERDFGGEVTRDAERTQLFARTDLTLPAWEHHTFEAGATGQLRKYVTAGPVEDTRTRPTWAATPLGDFGSELVTLQQQDALPQVAVYAQHSWEGPVRTRLGVRGTWVGRSNEILPGPSVGLSMPLSTGTVPKISAGLYHHVVEDPLATDVVYGNPDLEAERAWNVVVGVDQALPIGDGAFLRVEAYAAKLENLVVNPDNQAAVDRGVTFTNDGSGRNLGVDVMFAARTERVQVTTNLSLLDAKRDNPLNDVFQDEYVPSQAQAVTAGASVEYQLTPKWRVTGRYDYHSGRPSSSVEPGGPDTIQLAALNDQRLGDFHQLDLRVEWRHATPRLRWSVYLEVLNVLYLQNDFLPTATMVDGELTEGMFKHLPTRPFLGVRADF